MGHVIVFLWVSITQVLLGLARAARDVEIELHNHTNSDGAEAELVRLSDSCAKPPTLSDTSVWRGQFEVPLWMQELSDGSDPLNLFYTIGGPYSDKPESECQRITPALLGTDVNLGNTGVCRMKTATVAKLSLGVEPEVVDLERHTATVNCMLTGTGCMGHSTAIDGIIVKFFGSPIQVAASKVVGNFPRSAAKIPGLTPVVRYIEPLFHPKGIYEWHSKFIVHEVMLPSGNKKWYAIAMHQTNEDGLCYIDRLFACQWTKWARYGWQQLPERGIWYGHTQPGKQGEECVFEEGQEV